MTNDNGDHKDEGTSIETEEETAASTPNAMKELMLADLERLGESFWRNEESGERRVSFYITLVTAVIAALATLFKIASENGTGDGMSNLGHVSAIVIMGLTGLWAFGIMTFLRMIRRNNVTDEYKAIMNHLRRIFCDQYRPFPNKDKTKPPDLYGGLTDIVAVINGLVFATTAYLIAVVVFESEFRPDWTIAAVSVGIAVAIHATMVGCAAKSRKDYKKSLKCHFETRLKENKIHV